MQRQGHFLLKTGNTQQIAAAAAPAQGATVGREQVSILTGSWTAVIFSDSAQGFAIRVRGVTAQGCSGLCF
jgi:hypothetical protein